MHEILEIKELNTEDIQFLKRDLKKSYMVALFLALIGIVLPAYFIYLITVKSYAEDKEFALLMVIVVFSFWTYIAVKGIIDVREEKQNLLLQKKIEGNVSILKKEVVTNEGYESDTLSHEITIYSPIEEKYRNISIYKKDYNQIQVGDFVKITYFTDNTSIKDLIFEDRNLKSKYFTTIQQQFDK